MATSLTQAALVSVIIPCHNHARFLSEAIDSVLKQTYPHIELIVVDDGSTDDITRVIQLYPGITYVRQDQVGVSRARNVGLSHSRGAYLVFLDADDRLLPDAVAIGVDSLDSRTDHAFTFGSFIVIGTSQGLRELHPDRNYDYQELLQRCFVGTPGAVLFHRWVFDHIEAFDESNGPAADYDLYLRLAREFPFFVTIEPLSNIEDMIPT